MRLQTYRTRPTCVTAIQYDGDNLDQINGLLLMGRRAPLTDMLEVGAWVTFNDDTFQVLPNSAFHRIYEHVEEPVARSLPPEAERTCFRCTHYAMTNGSVGICTLFGESIHSETDAASDCSAYEPLEETW